MNSPPPNRVDLNHINRTICTQAITKLLDNCPGVTAAMIALRDGRPFMDRGLNKVDSGKFAAMSSSLQALGSSVLKELDAGRLEHLVVTGEQGTLVITSIPESMNMLTLAVLTEGTPLLGMVLGRSKVCAQTIATAL